MSDPSRVVLCGGVYSDNLGDAVIGDCLAHSLGQHLPKTQIVRMDIAGRRAYGETGLASKGPAYRLLIMMPKSAGQLIVLLAGSLYVKRVIEPAWQRSLDERDSVVIGGGQLFQDEQLNFPLKMWWLARNIRANHINTFVYSVGVSTKWTRLGRALFRPMFHSSALHYCSVRDDGSRRNLLRHFPDLGPSDIEIDPDPALLAGMAFESVVEAAVKKFDVGIGIMHPRALKLRCIRDHPSLSSITRKWTLVIGALLDRGMDLALFTNGALEDEEYLRELAEEFRGEKRLTVLQRPSTPATLVANVSSMRSIIAHRLHANIIAYALNIPSLGLRWDPKVDHFYAMCRRQEWVVDLVDSSVDQFVARTDELAKASIDLEVRDGIVDNCQAGVGRLAAHLSSFR